MELDRLDEWIGSEEEVRDVVTPATLGRLAALLDHDDPPWRPGELPPLAHWLHCVAPARHSGLGEDGHPARGGFLPPVPLPRRMWAGSDVRFLSPILVGDEITRRSRVAAIERKSGRSGEMIFVRVDHEIRTGTVVAITEAQDVVYREPPPRTEAGAGGSPASPDAPIDAEWRRVIRPDPVLLFRYSALGYIGHRIHYDRPYVVGVEGYPGLVVQGPLTATLLVDLFLRARPRAEVRRIRVRARRPLFDLEPFGVEGKPRDGGADLWALDPQGETAMTVAIDVA